MLRRLTILVFALGVLLLVTNCAKKAVPGIIRVAVVLDVGGIEDRGKNAMIWRGCMNALEQIPVEINVQEPSTLPEAKETLEKLIADEYDLLIVASGPLAPTAIEWAEKASETKFLIIDSQSDVSSAKTVSFPSYESGYLMGLVAGNAAPTGIVGFIGGREDKMTEDISDGFRDGVKEVAPNTKVLPMYIGTAYDAALDEEKAREIVSSMYDADVAGVFCVAGYSSSVIMEITKERGKWAIGFETNQLSLEEGYVLASLIRRLDDIVCETILCLADNETEFETGCKHYCLDGDVIEYTIDNEHPALRGKNIEEILELAEEKFIEAEKENNT